MKKALFFITVVLYAGGAIPPLHIQAADIPLRIASARAAEVSTPQTLSLRVTAYTSVPEETDSTPFITASGQMVRDGIVATNLLPFGTDVMIPSLFGDKVFVVEDRMNKKMGNSLDIWMPTKSKALFFGVHYNAKIVILSTSTVPVTPVVAFK
jgi:3D (Asp-Asp-Asp) domain-containing protein